MILTKTPLGQQVLKDRCVQLTPRQRSALVMVDGRRALEDILAATASTGLAREDMDRLVELGLAAEVAGGPGSRNAPAIPDPHPAAGHDTRSPGERYAAAYPIASALTAGLGLRGFRLNLAVEGATSYEELLAVAPRIREAVGADKFAALERALGIDAPSRL